MVMYKTAASSLLNLEDRWFSASTERLHPLKLPGSGLDVSSAATLPSGLKLDMPVPVRAFTPQPEEFRFEFASLSSGNSLSLIPSRVSALKDSRQTSHRQRLPRVRAPPSDLWNVLDAKSPSSQQHTTSLPCGPTASSDTSSIQYNEDKAASAGGPMAVDRRPSVSMSRQSPIGTGRPQGNESGSRQFEDHTIPWGSGSPATSSSRLSPPSPTSDDTILVSLSPGIAARRRTPTPLSRSFFDVLLENKRRHPHAPTMVSMLNPLREKVTFRAWACIPVRSGGQATKEQLALPSSRFQNSLSSLSQSTRSRQACDLACSNLRVNKRFYLRKNSYHCSHCKKDSIHKKLLVILYFGNHLRNLFKPSLYGRPTYTRSTNALKLDTNTNSALSNLMGRPAVVVDSESYMDEDSDILDTPLLKDLDDFDDYEDALDDMDEGILADEDSLESDEVDADGDTEMHEADLN